MVSFDRYMAICQPLKYRTMKLNKQKTFTITALIWIISVPFSLLEVPLFANLVHVCITWPTDERYKHFPSSVRYCYSLHPLMETVSSFIYIVPFSIALIITAINNIRVIHKLRQPHPGNNKDQARRQIRRRISWMLMANSTLFFVVWHQICFFIFMESQKYHLLTLDTCFAPVTFLRWLTLPSTQFCTVWPVQAIVVDF